MLYHKGINNVASLRILRLFPPKARLIGLRAPSLGCRLTTSEYRIQRKVIPQLQDKTYPFWIIPQCLNCTHKN